MVFFPKGEFEVKKKIAVFANGLNAENLMKYMNGIKETCEDGFADFHVFLSHDSYGNKEMINRAEWSVYNLPNLKNYDGAIFFGPGLNYEDVNSSIIGRCKKAGIPTISISSEYEDTVRIYTDNYDGMKMIIDHLLDVHNIHSALFIAGPKDNAESNERLRAVKDAFATRNIPFEENNITYSNWVAYNATDFVKDRFYSKEGLPDAIICANDSTAYFVCFILQDLGVKCPDEVYVTGFDGDSQAMNFYPSITTAVQPFYEMGVKSIECFKDIFAGNTVKSSYYTPCIFRKAESCGCDTSEKYDEYRRNSSVKTYKNIIMNDLHFFRIKGLTDAILKSESYSTLDSYLQEFFYESDGVEGNPFYICMDPDFERMSEVNVSDLPLYHYNVLFQMIVGKNGDRRYETTMFNSENGLIPFEQKDEINHIYVFLPIYHKTYVCGYMVMGDNIEYFGTGKYNFMHTHFNRLIDQYIKNIQLTFLNNKLSRLMNTDALTSTKNRMAFETQKEILDEEIKREQLKDIAFVVADINNLKEINDSFGHECGDEYIKNASSFMCRIFKHSPVFRTGGDEFVIMLRGDDYNNRNELLAKMNAMMSDIMNNEVEPVKRISVAFGLADYDGNIDNSIDDTLKRADDIMYENKREFKRHNK